MAEEQGNIYAPTEVRVDDVRAAGEWELATRLSRLGASIIDGIIVGVPLLIVGFIAFPDIFATLADESRGLVSEILYSLGIFAVGFLAYAAVNWIPLEATGQTIGKKLVNIRIVRSDGSPVGAKRALFIRYLPMQSASMLPFIGTLVWLADAVMIFRASHKCLHDDIADTIVIKT